MIYSDEERKFNKDITMGLIRSELLNLAEYNVHMAKLLDGGRNSMYKGMFLLLVSSNIVEPTDSCMKFAEAATEFAISLLQTLVTDESRVVISELHNLVDALAKVVFVPLCNSSFIFTSYFFYLYLISLNLYLILLELSKK